MMNLRGLACISMLAAAALAAQTQTILADGVLSQSSDLTGCAAQPSPIPHTTPGGIRSPVNPDVGGNDACSDLGSTYQIASGGHVFGVTRTAADVQRDAALQAQGSSPGAGVLAGQPTGLHVAISRSGDLMRVKLKERQSAYTILYMR